MQGLTEGVAGSCLDGEELEGLGRDMRDWTGVLCWYCWSHVGCCAGPISTAANGTVWEL